MEGEEQDLWTNNYNTRDYRIIGLLKPHVATRTPPDNDVIIVNADGATASFYISKRSNGSSHSHSFRGEIFKI